MAKIRGKRRYYRKIKKRIQNFNHHLSEENSWYNMWHIHFDGKGISEKIKDRRSHIRHYIVECYDKNAVEKHPRMK
jgi:hypothetical protein